MRVDEFHGSHAGSLRVKVTKVVELHTLFPVPDTA